MNDSVGIELDRMADKSRISRIIPDRIIPDRIISRHMDRFVFGQMNFDLNRFVETGAEVALEGFDILDLEYPVRGRQIQADDAVFLRAFDAEEIKIDLLPMGILLDEVVDAVDHSVSKANFAEGEGEGDGK